MSLILVKVYGLGRIQRETSVGHSVHTDLEINIIWRHWYTGASGYFGYLFIMLKCWSVRFTSLMTLRGIKVGQSGMTSAKDALRVCMDALRVCSRASSLSTDAFFTGVSFSMDCLRLPGFCYNQWCEPKLNLWYFLNYQQHSEKCG